MMQDRITICRDPRCRDSMVLTGDDVMEVLRAPLTTIPATSGTEAHQFIFADDQEWKPNWQRLARCLRTEGAECQ